MMATTAAAPTTTTTAALYDRNDIHRACKSLETLLSVLSDYSEAAGAIALMQKKLARALRDTASQKATSEVAGQCQPLRYTASI